MGHQIRLSDNTDVNIKRSRRARRMSLRVSSIDGRVTLTVPPRVSDRSALAFVNEKADWIEKALARCHDPVAVEIGAEIPIAGHLCGITAGNDRSARLCNGRIAAPLSRTGPAVEALIKHIARERLGVAVARYAEALGVEARKITLRDPRSRWGSCTSEGNLMFSWRLVMAPTAVLDYVAAHEVAHLRHMDHSTAFWDCVGSIEPGFEAPRAWLREEGINLHRYRFRGL